MHGQAQSLLLLEIGGRAFPHSTGVINTVQQFFKQKFFTKVEIVGFGSKGPLGLDEWFTWGPSLLGLVLYIYSLGLFFVSNREKASKGNKRAL